MKTRKKLREVLNNIESDIPALKARYGDGVELLAQVRSMTEYATMSAGPDDRDWMVGQVDTILKGFGIPWTARSTH